MNILTGVASFAQSRIWLDERVRFDGNAPKLSIYNMPFLSHVQHGSLSAKRLRHAMELVVLKHAILHSALYFDNDKQELMQRIVAHEENEELFPCVESRFVNKDEDLMKIMHDERGNPFHFNLERGIVCRLHIVRDNSSENDELMSGDSIIFNFHHAQFDFPSMIVFHRDLIKAYTTGQLNIDSDNELRYLDCKSFICTCFFFIDLIINSDAIIERQMPMIMAKTFWNEVLDDYSMDRSISLPYDRHRISNEQRTGRGISFAFDLGKDLSSAFLQYAITNRITAEELSLVCYLIFLFKLSNGERDLCVGMNTNGRYKQEFQSIIGMFVNAIPLRLSNLDPSSAFSHLIEQVKNMFQHSMKMSYFPLQRILNVASSSFLDTSFEYQTSKKNIDDEHVSIGNAILSLISYSLQVGSEEFVSKFDFLLRFEHDLIDNQLSCTIDASLDLFNRETIFQISRRFQFFMEQLFLFKTFDHTSQPICQLSIVLPDEWQYIQSINNQTSEMNFQPMEQFQLEFLRQAMIHPQKIAVSLEEQCLTYSEMLVKACQISDYLDEEEYSGEIICQCVERSIEMVIGQLAILMSGCSYCALSPDDPSARLNTLVEQTKSPVVLVHSSTANHLSDNQRVINLHHYLLDPIDYPITERNIDRFDDQQIA